MTPHRTLVALWICTVASTVLCEYVTRSTNAQVNAFGGALIVVTCTAAALIACASVRLFTALVITASLAAILASTIAWAVLHDASSTAALGVISPGIVSAVVTIAGVALSTLIERRRPRAGLTPE
jgi:hypothetical protein